MSKQPVEIQGSHAGLGLLPLSPYDHPEPRVMVWSELEMQAIRNYAAACVAAERERWRELLKARSAGCERAAENTEDAMFDAMARVLMDVREDGSMA